MNRLLDSLVEYWEFVDGKWIDRCKGGSKVKVLKEKSK